MILPLFPTLWFWAQLIFSEFLLAMKASLPLWSAVKLFVNILLVIVCIFAFGLLMKVEGSFGFYSRASWNGEKPCTFASEYSTIILSWYQCLILLELCLEHVSNNQVMSFHSTITKWCFCCCEIQYYIDLHISIKLELANSSPLSPLLISLWLRTFASSF